MRVKNGLADLIAFGKNAKIRKSMFRAAPAVKPPEGGINMLAKQLHPGFQSMKIVKVTNETPDTRTFRLKCTDGLKPAIFRAGQYIVISFEHEGLLISRPYSISSTPAEAREDGYYEITIKNKADDGFFSPAAFESWREGTGIIASGPCGSFYYEKLRDAIRLVCIAGGSGITPFRSIITEELAHRPELSIALLYGFNRPDDEAFGEEFLALADKYSRRFEYKPVTGLISAEQVAEAAGEGSVSYFVCGPEGLHRHIDSVLQEQGVERKRIRRESFGLKAANTGNEVFTVTAVIRGVATKLPSAANETIATALERAGLAPPVQCRAGECGWCRSRLVSGSVKIGDGLTGQRAADKKFGYIHPCVSYPASDLVINLPLNPVSAASTSAGGCPPKRTLICPPGF